MIRKVINDVTLRQRKLKGDLKWYKATKMDNRNSGPPSPRNIYGSVRDDYKLLSPSTCLPNDVRLFQKFRLIPLLPPLKSPYSPISPSAYPLVFDSLPFLAGWRACADWNVVKLRLAYPRLRQHGSHIHQGRKSEVRTKCLSAMPSPQRQ